MFVRPTKKQFGLSFIIAAALNQVLAPIASMREMSYTLNVENPKLLVTDEFVEKNSFLPKDANILDYLNAADNLAHKSAGGDYDLFCRDYGRAIFDIYQQLVRLNGRADLSDKIRVCAEMKRKNGHLWIEYEQDDKIVPYEMFEPERLTRVGVRTFWGTKTSYPTAYAIFKPGGTLAVLLED